MCEFKVSFYIMIMVLQSYVEKGGCLICEYLQYMHDLHYTMTRDVVAQMWHK